MNQQLIFISIQPLIEFFVSLTGQNLRLQYETGLIVAIDGVINPETPSPKATYVRTFAVGLGF